MCWAGPLPRSGTVLNAAGAVIWLRGVTVSTLESESSDRGSNPREALTRTTVDFVASCDQREGRDASGIAGAPWVGFATIAPHLACVRCGKAPEPILTSSFQAIGRTSSGTQKNPGPLMFGKLRAPNIAQQIRSLLSRCWVAFASLSSQRGAMAVGKGARQGAIHVCSRGISAPSEQNQLEPNRFEPSVISASVCSRHVWCEKARGQNFGVCKCSRPAVLQRAVIVSVGFRCGARLSAGIAADIMPVWCVCAA